MSVSWNWLRMAVNEVKRGRSKKISNENVTVYLVPSKTPVIRIDIKLEPKGGDSNDVAVGDSIVQRRFHREFNYQHRQNV